MTIHCSASLVSAIWCIWHYELFVHWTLILSIYFMLLCLYLWYDLYNNNTGQDKDQNQYQKAPRPKARQSLTWLQNSVGYRTITAIAPFKVTDFGTNRKLIYGFLYTKTIARQVLRIKSLEFTNLLEIYTVGVARSLSRRLQLDIVFVNSP